MPVLKYNGKPQIQEGGATAIANHIRGFVKHVDILSNPLGSIVKTRFYDPFDNRKHVEINKFDHESYGEIPKINKHYDVVIVAGKGHETYQETLGVKHPFVDAQHAASALGRWQQVSA